jgi:hypothetical protein
MWFLRFLKSSGGNGKVQPPKPPRHIGLFKKSVIDTL